MPSAATGTHCRDWTFDAIEHQAIGHRADVALVGQANRLDRDDQLIARLRALDVDGASRRIHLRHVADLHVAVDILRDGGLRPVEAS